MTHSKTIPRPDGVEWKKITSKTKEPDKEVLAIGYQDEMLVGWLCKNKAGEWGCESSDTVLEECVGYILVSDLVKIYHKQHS